MAFDIMLAERIRQQLGQDPRITEKKLFGGLAFLLNGNMCCGVHAQELIVRLDPAQTEQALNRQHTRIFDLSGRPMKGWVLVQPEALINEAALAEWIQVGLNYASALAPK